MCTQLNYKFSLFHIRCESKPLRSEGRIIEEHLKHSYHRPILKMLQVAKQSTSVFYNSVFVSSMLPLVSR